VRILRWLKRHWYIPLLAIVGIVGFIFGVFRSPGEAVQRELHAIKAGEKARLDAIDRGVAAAIAQTNIDYQETIRKLNEKQRRKLDRLLGDPAERVRFLERVAGQWPANGPRDRAANNLSGEG
jgi:hypothetical protein